MVSLRFACRLLERQERPGDCLPFDDGLRKVALDQTEEPLRLAPVEPNDAGLHWSGKEYVIVRLREASSEEREQRREPDSAPAKPTGLSATATHDRVTLTWDDPNDDSVTGYVILRRPPRVPRGYDGNSPDFDSP